MFFEIYNFHKPQVGYIWNLDLTIIKKIKYSSDMGSYINILIFSQLWLMIIMQIAHYSSSNTCNINSMQRPYIYENEWVHHEYWLCELNNLCISNHAKLLWLMCHCNKYCYANVCMLFLFQLSQHEIYVTIIYIFII